MTGILMSARRRSGLLVASRSSMVLPSCATKAVRNPAGDSSTMDAIISAMGGSSSAMKTSSKAMRPPYAYEEARPFGAFQREDRPFPVEPTKAREGAEEAELAAGEVAVEDAR